MVSRRTLLLFNFGACLTFAVMGLLSAHVITTLLPGLGETLILPQLSGSVRKDLLETQQLELLRSQALFFYDLSMDFKRAQAASEQLQIEAVRYVCYLLAATAGVGGMLVLALKEAARPSPAALKQAPGP